MNSGNFSQYDYGENNTLVYGKTEPPLYNISKITAPVSLYYSNNDWLAAQQDVERLRDLLPNVSKSTLLSADGFNHLDFLWARDVVESVYNDVITEILLCTLS